MAPAKTKNETPEETVVRMRNDGSDWASISEAVGMGQGKVALIYLQQTVDPKDRITAKNDEEMAKKITAARNSGLSWGIISARSGLPESRCRALFDPNDRGRGNRIGKGGRHPGDTNGTSPATTAGAKKAGAKKAAAPAKAASKSTVTGGSAGLGDMTLAQLKARLDGKTITVEHSRDGRKEKIGVASVSRIKEGELTFKDATGKTRSVLLTEIKGATK